MVVFIFHFFIKTTVAYVACSYMGFEAPKISWLQEIFDIHLLIALGTSLKIFDGWFECLLM